jgi:hypothetical protein
MLKIWSMKQQQQQAENAAGTAKKKKVTAAQLRVQKGMCVLPLLSVEQRLIHPSHRFIGVVPWFNYENRIS